MCVGTLDVEVAGLRGALQKVSTEHSEALDALKTQMKDDVVTKLEEVDRKLEDEIANTVTPLAEKVRADPIARFMF